MKVHFVQCSEQPLVRMYLWYKCHYINITAVKHQIVYLITSTHIKLLSVCLANSAYVRTYDFTKYTRECWLKENKLIRACIHAI